MVRLSVVFMLVFVTAGQPLAAQQRPLSDPMRPHSQQVKAPLSSVEKAGEQVIDTAAWQLTAVLISERRSLAIVNGQALQKGDQLDGYKVISIQSDKVVLEHGHKQLVLHRTGTGLRKDIR